VYTGFFILVLGLILIFFLKPYLIRWGALRMRTGGAPMAMAVAGAGTGAGPASLKVSLPSEGGGEAHVQSNL
jgi:hypothetical protein